MSKRRNKKLTRDELVARTIVFIGFAIAFLVSITISTNLKTGNGVAIFFAVFIPTSTILLILFLVFNSAKVKGNLGERRVSKILRTIQKEYGGYVIDDVIIPDIDNEDNTSQLDHIYLSKYGIFVVETKNYAGRIYGSENNEKWTQTLAYGKSKNSFYNPIKQNNTHVIRLEKLLKTKSILSLVVFVQADISYVESSSVYTLRELNMFIRDICSNGSEIIETKKLESYFDLLNEYKTNPIKTNKEHVKHIKKQSKMIDRNICPRCGGKLVLRTPSKTNRCFYGCSNYPKCKFTKKRS